MTSFGGSVFGTAPRETESCLRSISIASSTESPFRSGIERAEGGVSHDSYDDESKLALTSSTETTSLDFVSVFEAPVKFIWLGNSSLANAILFFLDCGLSVPPPTELIDFRDVVLIFLDPTDVVDFLRSCRFFSRFIVNFI